MFNKEFFSDKNLTSELQRDEKVLMLPENYVVSFCTVDVKAYNALFLCLLARSLNEKFK